MHRFFCQVPCYWRYVCFIQDHFAWNGPKTYEPNDETNSTSGCEFDNVFIPRKDQCDVCVSVKRGNIDRDTFEAHIQAKDAARARTSKDKEAASDKVSVWTMDLQAVLLCPKTKASGMYYKTKFQVHNFTLFNLHTKEGFCYTWDESKGSLSCDMFAHLLYKHFSKVLDGNKK